MQLEIIVALTAACSALLVSLTTGVIQLLQIRTKHHLEEKEKVEQHLHDLDDESFRESQEGLREACKALQRFQDEILLLIRAAPNSLISDNQRQQIVEARNHLLHLYQQYHPILSDADRSNLNESRKKAVDIVLRLEFERIWNQEYLTLADGVIEELRRTSVTLGHYHQQLLFSYVSALNSRVSSIKGLSCVR